MKKQLFFLAVAALALASCSSENDVVQSPAVQETTADDGAVVFDAYMNRSTTRAGVPGAVTTNDLKSTATALGQAGFGVFGYYTNSSTYDQQAIPNFFYNQRVYCEDGTNFKYEPVKYWPNEFGSSANSDDADKVTYFAYAPWVSVNPNTGKPDGETDADKLSDLQKWGINSMTTNSTAGDPLIKYIASFDQAKSVDLCWGVCDETNWQKIQDGKSQTFTLGMPWENVERPANTNQKLKFTFKHATAQLKVNIDAFVDGITNATSIDSKTKVYVRAITFEGLATKGSLNLNNKEAKPNKAYWMDYNGVNDLPMGETVTVYDGRKDGKEGTLSGEATNEKSLGLNPNLVQSTLWSDASAKPGVTNVPQPLFRNGDVPATEPIYVIPTGDPVKVTITYDIETADKNLSTYVSDAEQHGSSIENVIWKNITFGKDAEGKDINTFENGKSYTLNLHLGMNSVKFDAAVTDWVAQSASDIDLPANIPSYEAKNPAGDAITTELAYDLTSYQFAITGLKPYEEVTPPSSAIAPVTAYVVAPAAKIYANASGVATVTLTLAKNTTVKNITTASDLEFEGAESGYGVKIKVTQKAAPLGLSVTSVNSGTKKIILDSEATGINWDIAEQTKNVTVLKNGIKLTTITSGSPTNTEALYDKSDHSILLSAIEEGDVYSITIKADDAAEETVTAKIGGISYANSIVNKVIGDTKFTNPLTIYGDGTVAYTLTSGDAVVSVDDNGELTLKGVTGSAGIKATFTPKANTYTFASPCEATYTVNVTDVVFSAGNYVMTAAASAADRKLSISGLGASASVTVAQTSGDALRIAPAIKSGFTDSGTADEADANGIATVTFGTATNTSGSPRKIVITVTSGGKTMTITVNQAN